ncbi:MAG: sulfatase [Verrucomicrobiae bacterium]|nr:sulfatase [Verrucomicrobiae bacterium]
MNFQRESGTIARLVFLGGCALVFALSSATAAEKKNDRPRELKPSPDGKSDQAEKKESDAPDPRPNLVFILADDMAWDDSEPYGNDGIRTPNLRRLASEGMRFDQAFLTISSCSPSRASIITGRYPHNTGAEELHWPVPGSQVTFVEKLKEAGYWTAAAGKWHLGDEIRDRFDEIREVDTSGFQLPTGKDGEAGKFQESLEGDAQSGCADWVPLLKDRPKDRPFFVWLAALDPHRDYHQGAIPDPHRPEDVHLAPYHPDTPEIRADYGLYYDEISRLDRFVGKVLEELKNQKILDKTLILFISDNGRPFPRDKTTLYDSGIRTPWIVRWPGKVEAGSVCGRLVSSIDIGPTFLAAAGLVEKIDSFEGRSFLPLLENPEAAIREFVFAEKNWHDFEDHARAVRNERYKYIRNAYEDLPLTPPADAVRSPTYEAMVKLNRENRLLPHQRACFTEPRPREELYDTIADPYELHNLATDGQHEVVLETLREVLDAWERRTGDTTPDLRTADEFDRETGKPTAARIRPRWSRERMVKAGLAAP